MKTKEIASQYGINRDEFELFVEQSGVKYKTGLTNLTSMVIEDGQDINALVANFKQHQFNLALIKEQNEKEAAAKRQQEIDEAIAERKRKDKAAADKKEALANMLITSGFNFDGYTITKYSGYISGDDVIQINRGTTGFLFNTTTDVGSALMTSLVTIRRNALAELKEAAYALGCNAVIGVDFDYLTLDPVTANSSGGTLYLPYVFGVTANGNAVIIEKNKTTDEK